MKCPRCGSDIQTGYALGNMAGATATVRTPSGHKDSVDLVATSFLRALITGTLGGLLVGLLLKSFRFGGIGFGVAFALVWLSLMWEDRRLLWIVEEFTGVDIDRDKVVGKPEVPETWVVRDGGHHQFKAQIPFRSRVEGNRVATAALVQKVRFSRRALIDCGALENDPEHYSEIYQAMENAGFISGNGLTKSGREYLSNFLPTPLARRVLK